MKVIIGWRKCKRYPYTNRYGCPLFHALTEAGIPVLEVGRTFILTEANLTRARARAFNFNFNHWNPLIQQRAASRHRSVVLEIPELEESRDSGPDWTSM